MTDDEIEKNILSRIRAGEPPNSKASGLYIDPTRLNTVLARLINRGKVVVEGAKNGNKIWVREEEKTP